MSFLDDIVDVGSSVTDFFTGNSMASSLVKVVALGFIASQLSKNTAPTNNGSNSSTNANIDAGVRLQIPPASENKIPVLYGTAYTSGIITDAIMSSNNQVMTYCMTISEQTRSFTGATTYQIGDTYWNNNRIVFQSDGLTIDYTVDHDGNVDRSMSGLVKLWFYAGGTSNSVRIVPNGYTNTTSINAYDIMPGWTAVNNGMNNLVFAIVQLNYNKDKNVTGIGTLKFQIISNLNNPGGVLNDYMQNTVYGAGIPGSSIDVESLSALDSYAAQSISYTDDQGQQYTLNDQFQINGLLDTAQPVMANIDKICSASGAWMSYDNLQGKWRVVLNTTGTSITSFSDHNILGNISLTGSGLTNFYNSVKVQFPNRDLQDASDYTTISVPSGDRNPNEPNNVLNLTYDIINDPIQAQLLGFIELKQSRVDKIIKFQADFSYISLGAGQIIDVTNTRFGFDHKLFRILTVSEIQDTQGSLIVEITALEYDASVYNPNNLVKYTRTDQNGIITIGSIGIPSTPNVTKFEQDPRPHVIITTTVPTGIVTGMEVWYSGDVSLAENSRTYNLISTTRPNGGGVYNSGDTVTVDYDTLGTQNFVVKVRGFNGTTVGPFSDPSGLIEFTAVQTTQAINSNTQMTGLPSAIGLLGLLGLLNSLMSGSSSTGGLFDKIFSIFKDTTGVDLINSGHNLVPGDEIWSSAAATVETYTVDNVQVKRFSSVTFNRENGTQVTLLLPNPNDY